jgi:hypothetical protein
MKLFKYSTIIVLLMFISACSVNEDKFPIPLDTVLNTNGAYLTVLNVETAIFDILDLDNAAYVFNGEIFDREGGDLIQNVEFYASYTSIDGATLPETSQPFKTLDRAAFTSSEGSLPRARIEIKILDAMAALGLTSNDISLGDRFNIRWVLNLTTGQSVTRGDASPDAEGAFRTPYQANISVLAVLPPDLYVGSYEFEQMNGGVFGWWAFSQVFTTDVSINPDNTATGRIFTAEPYADNWGGLAPINVPFNIGVTIAWAGSTEGQGVGLGCGGPGLAIGPAQQGAGPDLSDDSSFTLWLADNVRGDCGAPPVDVRLEATKQ